MADFALDLQTELVTLLRDDAALTALIGNNKIFDAPRRGQRPAVHCHQEPQFFAARCDRDGALRS